MDMIFSSVFFLSYLSYDRWLFLVAARLFKFNYSMLVFGEEDWFILNELFLKLFEGVSLSYKNELVNAF